MPSAACAVVTAAGAPSATVKAVPRTRFLIRIALLPLVGTPALDLGREAGAARLEGWSSWSRRRYWSKCAPSVRKGPHPQLLLADLPQPRQPGGLGDQKDED